MTGNDSAKVQGGFFDEKCPIVFREPATGGVKPTLRMLAVFALVLFSVFDAGLSVAQAPDSLLIDYVAGVRLSAEGDAEGALRHLERALKANPDHDPSLYEAAIARLGTGKGSEQALEYARRAMTLDPSNRWYKQLTAKLLMNLTRYGEALEIYKELTAPGSRFDPDSWQTLAMLYYEQGKPDDALSTLDSIELRMGRSPELMELRRGLLVDAGRMDEAMAATEKYIAETPYDEDNRLALAEMYAYRGRDSLARATLEDVLRINPENVEAIRQLGPQKQEVESAEKLLAKGDIEGALVLMKASLPPPEDDPADFASMKTYMDITSIESYLRRTDSVMLYCRRALRVYPHVVAFHTMIAGVYQYEGRFGEALKTLEKALGVTPSRMQQSDVVSMIASMWHEQGNDRKAFTEYERALRLNPDNTMALNNYAYYLAIDAGARPAKSKTRRTDLDRALEMAGKAIAAEPVEATFLDTYAWVLYLRGEYAEAKRIMGQALPLDRGNSPELFLHYGDILWALGEDFMAVQYWKRARDAGYEPVSEIERRLSQKR